MEINKIYNIDCLELMAQMPDKFISLAICDPPYGIGEDGGKSESRCQKTKVKPNNFIKKGWDKKPPNKIYFDELFRISKNQIIWGANHFIEKINKNSSCWIVWDKDNGTNDYADCELAYTSFNTAVRKFTYKWHGMLQQNMKQKEIRIHLTQKPVSLYKWLLNNYAKQGDIIFDSHLGSASSIVACIEYDFDYIGCEIDTDYFNDAQKRIKNAKINKQTELKFNY